MIRVGAVGFLNARPLEYGLDRDPQFAVRLDVPSRCAALLHAGEIDLGLVPVIELLRGRVAYDIVPGLAIACDGPVQSVALFTRVPVPQVRSIALDVSSRSSVGLLRVLCRHHFGIAPTFVDATPDLAAMLSVADAALVIGDPALEAPYEALGAQKIDLGEAWKAFTGLPFVFATWIARPGVISPALVTRLHEARRAGVEAIEALARAEAGARTERAAGLEQYLRHNIRYDLDEGALRGLSRYLTLAMADGLAPQRPDVLRAVEALGVPAAVRSQVGEQVGMSTAGKGTRQMSLQAIVEKVERGERIDADEALVLYRDASTWQLGRLADAIRARRHPERVVTYIIDRNVNYTNVCVARCNFCAFYRTVGSPDGYVLSREELFAKIDETISVGGNQLLLQGGHNPDIPLAWYEDLFRAVKAQYPTFRLHALSPPEILHISRMSKLPVPEVVSRLIAAGLDSVPGGGAEILVDRVRKLLNCYGKATADEWLGVMREVHLQGLRTTATMMYGSVETPEERIEHMMRLRTLQDETGGFTAFITWSYQPDHTELAGVELTGVEYLRTLALARIVLDNFDNLQASWVTQGGKVGQLSLAFGANDMGSVMIEENVVRAAGASYCMDEVEIVRNIENMGFTAMRRNMHYDLVGQPVFRERAVPRRLSLDVAKKDGADLMPAELAAYEARTRAERERRAQVPQV
ncbi:hypothetical protein TBR22_A33600 [Luteitalea sp. TBR-22]|uniref:cyclic dehypoxanthinyl futalosine synthase n=1 Tax=Luteitalea sp. TBR-22 TaxID=2802971 RepID=UPI001AF6979D|nr:cyclic dehypoxanthinyl futalosine synthase [Luteitalea sp. TBR-22]BCS34131.1 hypothetical protein TBR22_A33600 [Luteitalea sp. TBR-22]